MTKKEKAARKAAAKYSNNLAFAVLEYVALSRQNFPIKFTIEEYNTKLRDEMLSLLPPYRHPMPEFTECILFFDPDGIKLEATMYESPNFLKELEKERIADHLLKGIKEYVRESELRKIELAQCLELKQKFSDAARAYADYKDKKRIEKRNAEIVKKLGLSTKRGRPLEFDSFKMWVDYVIHVRKEGMSLSKAVQEVRKKYGRMSTAATRKALHEQRAFLKRKVRQRYSEMYDEAKKCLRGLVPTKR